MFEKTILCHERFDSVRLEELAQASYHVKEDWEQVLHAGKMRPARGLDKPAARHPKRLLFQFATHSLQRFERHYELIAKPFEWKFTRDDLNKLVQRLHLPAQPVAALAA